MRCGHIGTLAPMVALISLSACQAPPGQPGPMERAGAHVDRTVTDVQRSVGDFGVRAGQGIDQAGRSVGHAATQAGTGLHDRLAPSGATGDAAGGRAAPPPPPVEETPGASP